MASSARAMMRPTSQGSDGSHSGGESVESPTTTGTLYTPETARFKTSGMARNFAAIPSGASPAKPTDPFDLSALQASLKSTAQGLSATANTFTPTNSKLAQLTATSTPDNILPSSTRAATHMGGMASSSFQLPTFDLGPELTPTRKGKATVVVDPNATRYVKIEIHDQEHLTEALNVLHEALSVRVMASRPVQQTNNSYVSFAYRFDSIRDANAMAVDTRIKLLQAGMGGCYVEFINAARYKELDPSLEDPMEGTIILTVSGLATAAELCRAGLEQSSLLGIVHAYNVSSENISSVSIEVTFDSTKAANLAYQKLNGHTSHEHTFYTQRPMIKPRIDSFQLSGNGVKLPASYTTNRASLFDDARSTSVTPMKAENSGFSQPAIYFRDPWGTSLAARVGPSAPVSLPVHDFSYPRVQPESLQLKHVRGTGKQNNPVDINKILNGNDIRTTIMLRNIPNKMTADELKQIIDKTSWGHYDFSYLRIDFANQCNVGYAFINFTKPEYIINFLREHNGRPWGLYNSDKIAEVSYATRQGLSSLIDLFQNSCVMEEIPEHRPKLWYTESDGAWCGQEKPFPPPTNLQKLQRSRDMAATVGLYPPRGNRSFHQDERHRMSQYDRGTPQALRDAQLNMAYHNLGYPAMAPGFPPIGSPLAYPYIYPGYPPFYPGYNF